MSSVFSQDDFTEDVESEKITNVSGVVTDASTGKVVAGANVIVEGTDLGSAADEEGRYIIEGIEKGTSITTTAIGYEDLTLFADSEELNFELTPAAIEMSSLEVLASRASEKTAVAYSDVSKDEFSFKIRFSGYPVSNEFSSKCLCNKPRWWCRRC